MSENAEMECPKCGGSFETKSVGEAIKIDRCNKCSGLFVPVGVTHKLLADWAPDTNPDTGSAKVGEKFDKVDDIDCPRCHIKMDKIEDIDQPHIWLESCPGCGATFFDAGELTDLKEKTLSDFFKRFTKGARR